ncbi:RNA polymerase sigma-70 factor (ECF subfamily) [Pedobacter cryoconitis]|uniref:RNA polymerase sigma-70 factor (ECF subfamily) n=1 Tax=Pedobacter cryoconitis TaxID=188932 RepID=A0A7W8YTQ1_9SPHI|nr:sigma-70 family RNA polymerase sigma factor [Pedobacter cryoconitis]MBB5621646.1 RNA polymerase sigma-70 factor (ECF subfamily) [Pedobacter cryoconitis]MBB5644228.1 RNA polymerase sigma-70 factor (ECF subfamily) [Pedobacter cryoconitis]
MYTERPYKNVLESELLVQVAAGDQKAFAELFERYQALVYDFSSRLTRSKIQAEEIVQNVFIRIWLKRAHLVNVENFGAYLNRATRNHSYTALKKIAAQTLREVELTGQVITGGTDAEHLLLYNDSAKILKTAVDSLPPQRKLVYELCHEQGLKYEEAAAKLNISPGTVHTHMKLALKAIREHFKYMDALLIVLMLMKK